MNTRILPLVAALLVLGAAGCADDRMSLEVQAVCAPNDTCTFAGKCDTILIGSFTHFVSVDSFLWVPLQVANQAPNNGDLNVGRVNSNDAHMTGIEVDFSGAATATTRVDWGNQLIPAGGTSVVSAYLPSPPVDGYLSAEVRLVGYYDNGRQFVTPNFHLTYFVDTLGIATCVDPTKALKCPASGGQLPANCG